MAVVIIPAAGLGTRMAAPTRDKPAATKQFVKLHGVPVVVHTLRRFAANAEISDIFVALRKSEVAPFRARLERDSPEILKKKMVLIEAG